MLLLADELGSVPTIALIAALTQERHLLRRSDGNQMDHDRELLLGNEAESDFFVLIRAWIYANEQGPERSRRLGIRYAVSQQVGRLFRQFLDLAKSEKLNISGGPDDFNAEALGKCMLVGFSDHLGRRIDAGTLRCDLVHRRHGVLARESAVQKSPLFVAAEIREIQGRKEDLLVLLSFATAIREEWLQEVFLEDFQISETLFYDPSVRRVVAQSNQLFLDLILHSAKTEPKPSDPTAAELAAEGISSRCPLAPWDHEVEQSITRVTCLTERSPELGLPKLDEEGRKYLISQICQGALIYRQIQDRSVFPTAKAFF